MSYRKQDLRKLDTAQREEINEACRNILRANRILETLQEPPRTLEFNNLRFSHQIPDDVLEFLWGTVGYHSAWGTPPPGREGQEGSNNGA